MRHLRIFTSDKSWERYSKITNALLFSANLTKSKYTEYAKKCLILEEIVE